MKLKDHKLRNLITGSITYVIPFLNKQEINKILVKDEENYIPLNVQNVSNFVQFSVCMIKNIHV